MEITSLNHGNTKSVKRGLCCYLDSGEPLVTESKATVSSTSLYSESNSLGGPLRCYNNQQSRVQITVGRNTTM
jgi:hypothetical protein